MAMIITQGMWAQYDGFDAAVTSAKGALEKVPEMSPVTVIDLDAPENALLEPSTRCVLLAVDGNNGTEYHYTFGRADAETQQVLREGLAALPREEDPQAVDAKRRAGITTKNTFEMKAAPDDGRASITNTPRRAYTCFGSERVRTDDLTPQQLIAAAQFTQMVSGVPVFVVFSDNDTFEDADIAVIVMPDTNTPGVTTVGKIREVAQRKDAGRVLAALVAPVRIRTSKTRAA